MELYVAHDAVFQPTMYKFTYNNLFEDRQINSFGGND